MLRVRILGAHHVAMAAVAVAHGRECGARGIVCRGDGLEGMRGIGIHAGVVGEVGGVAGHGEWGQGRSLVVCAPGATLAERVEGSGGGEAARTSDRRPGELVGLGTDARWTGKGHATHADGGAGRRNGRRFLCVALAGLGQARGDSALEVGDDLWGRVPVEGWMGLKGISF